MIPTGETIIITARMTALNGDMAWRAPLADTPRLSDIICHGYSVVLYDGNRAPRMAKCIGCGKLSSSAWFIAPLGITQCGCGADCVTSKIERLWSQAEPGTSVFRVMGTAAVRMLEARAND